MIYDLLYHQNNKIFLVFHGKERFFLIIRIRKIICNYKIILFYNQLKKFIYIYVYIYFTLHIIWDL